MDLVGRSCGRAMTIHSEPQMDADKQGEVSTDPLLRLVNFIRANKQHAPLERIEDGARLREELGFDSFDLAELTVRIEDQFRVDVFAEGIVRTVGEVRGKIGAATSLRDVRGN